MKQIILIIILVILMVAMYSGVSQEQALMVFTGMVFGYGLYVGYVKRHYLFPWLFKDKELK